MLTRSEMIDEAVRRTTGYHLPTLFGQLVIWRARCDAKTAELPIVWETREEMAALVAVAEVRRHFRAIEREQLNQGGSP